MRSAELRERFLSFFKAKGHVVRPSDALIPADDPTVLFTSAGMNQFKPYFLGLKTDLTRAASCQKCLRTGDLDRVGKSPSHHSFFEMLGNFSFGDYFKAEAIQWGWEFLTGTLDSAGKRPSPHRSLCLSLPGSKLWVSIYEEDEEAFALWGKLGVPQERIRRLGQADNFWPANAPKEGPNGPCGPCSEIYFDADGAVAGPKSVEVWNLVFTQFDRQPDGSLKPLPRKNIDTGMGLERLARVLEGVATDYETDLFQPILNAICGLANGQPARGEAGIIAERALADHLRAIVFLLAEGVKPSNIKQGYVLRMLIRRACLYAEKRLDVGTLSPEMLDDFEILAASVEEAMRGSPYEAELARARGVIRTGLRQELTQFQLTLEEGSERLTALIARLRKAGQTVIPGQEAFRLYDTYGLPLEVTADRANEQGLTVDRSGFQAALEAQQERSRSASQFGGGIFVADTLPVRRTVAGLPPKDAHFIGYDLLQAEATIRGLWDGAKWVEQATAGSQVGIVLDRSPFYGEAGGQIGDAGVIEAPRGHAAVATTTWVDDVLIHQATVDSGSVRVGEPARARVDAERRLKIARSHTGTHLLHWALRKVLGPQAAQAGSHVDAERLRFDFASPKPLHEEQRCQVEALVNARVRLADEVRTASMRVDEAKQVGAIAMFGEQYGDVVRVVTIGDYSKELCGGTHLLHTGSVGLFAIAEESSIAAGTRRIEALVGETATARILQHERVLHQAAQRLGRSVEELLPGVEDLLEQLKRSADDRRELQVKLARAEAKQLVDQGGTKIGHVTFIAKQVKHADREVLAVLADAVRQSLPGEGVVCLASGEQAPVSVVMATTAGLVKQKRVHAGEMLKAIAPLFQGSGGGRPDFAQGGGKDPSGIPAAFDKAGQLIREALAQ